MASDLAAGQPPLRQPRARRRASGPSSRRWPPPGAMGADVPSLLRELAPRPGAGQLRTLAATWQVAHDTGSGLAAAIGQAAEAIRADRRTTRLVASELAAAHATARMLAVLPVGVLLLGHGCRRRPGGLPDSTRTAGLVCLAVGLGLSFAGMPGSSGSPTGCWGGEPGAPGRGWWPPGGAARSLLVLRPRARLPARRSDRLVPGRSRRGRPRCSSGCAAARRWWGSPAGGRMLGGRSGGPAVLPLRWRCGWCSGAAEDPAVVRRRERLLDDLPTGVDLLGSCLDAGAAPESRAGHRGPGRSAGRWGRSSWRSTTGSRSASTRVRCGGRSPATRSSDRSAGPWVAPTRPVRRSGGRCTSSPTSCASAPRPRSRHVPAASR